jgi:hypothetical protein
MRSMTMILCLECVLYVIALDPGTITIIMGVGFLDLEIWFVSGGSCILQPEGHVCVGICSKRGDECYFDLVFFLKSNLMVTRVSVEERE